MKAKHIHYLTLTLMLTHLMLYLFAEHVHVITTEQTGALLPFAIGLSIFAQLASFVAIAAKDYKEKIQDIDFSSDQTKQYIGVILLLLMLMAAIVDSFNSMPIAFSLSENATGVFAWAARFILLAIASIAGGAYVLCTETHWYTAEVDKKKVWRKKTVVTDKVLFTGCLSMALIAGICSGLLTALAPQTQSMNAQYQADAWKDHGDRLGNAYKKMEVVANQYEADKRLTKHPEGNLAGMVGDMTDVSNQILQAQLNRRATASKIFGSNTNSKTMSFGIAMAIVLMFFVMSAFGFKCIRAPYDESAINPNRTNKPNNNKQNQQDRGSEFDSNSAPVRQFKDLSVDEVRAAVRTTASEEKWDSLSQNKIRFALKSKLNCGIGSGKAGELLDPNEKTYRLTEVLRNLNGE